MAFIARVPVDIPAKYYRTIGEVVARWAHFEFCLMITIQKLLKLDPKQGRILVVGIAGNARIQVARALAKRCLGPGPLRQEILSILKAASPFLDKRNLYAHAVWGHNPKTRRFGIAAMREKEHRILPHFTPVEPDKISEDASALKDCQKRLERVNLKL